MVIKTIMAIGLVLGLASPTLAAMPASPLNGGTNVITVSQGCGAGWYRGPGGACHRDGYGPGRAYYHAPMPGRRCWRGEYGHWHCN